MEGTEWKQRNGATGRSAVRNDWEDRNRSATERRNRKKRSEERWENRNASTKSRNRNKHGEERLERSEWKRQKRNGETGRSGLRKNWEDRRSEWKRRNGGTGRSAQ